MPPQQHEQIIARAQKPPEVMKTTKKPSDWYRKAAGVSSPEKAKSETPHKKPSAKKVVNPKVTPLTKRMLMASVGRIAMSESGMPTGKAERYSVGGPVDTSPLAPTRKPIIGPIPRIVQNAPN